MTPHQIEAATAVGWPAQSETNIAGWRVFAGLGPVGRVNSCWPLDFDESDVDAATDSVEALYRAKGLAPQFKLIVDGCIPRDLYDRLIARGYHITSHVAVMTCQNKLRLPEHDVVITPHMTVAMLDVITQTSPSALDAQERAQILARVPHPSAFGAIQIDDTLAAVGLATFAGQSAGIAAMRTKQQYRQRGYARSIVRAVGNCAFDAGAELLWLQVDKGNLPAIRLYESEGFCPSYCYKTLRLV